MAADSAVTLASGKVFNTANKIFALSKYHPVGVMIYGNAELMGVPWETLVKVFRTKLGRKNCRKLDGYADDLMKYLKEIATQAYPPSQEQEIDHFSAAVRRFFRSFRQWIDEWVKGRLAVRQEVSKDEVEQEAARQVNEHYALWKGSSLVHSVSASKHKALKTRYREQLRKLRDEVFEDLPLSLAVVRRLNEMALSLFTRKWPYENPKISDIVDISGIVIAGYGEDDVFPRLRSFEFRGVLGGRLISVPQGVDIDAVDVTAGIIPFAQRDMVERFMEGIDGDYHRRLRQDLSQMWPRSLGAVIDEIAELNEQQKKRYKAGAIAAGEDAFGAYWQRLGDYRQDNYVQPVMDILHSLPKEELAEMAESLVSLTSLKRKMTTEQETVGGPIDVAVISKGDGLVWIKRKHYFSPELNPQFFATYNLDKEQEHEHGEE